MFYRLILFRTLLSFDALLLSGGEQLRGSACGEFLVVVFGGGGLWEGILVSQNPLSDGLRLCRTILLGERDALVERRQHDRKPIERRRLDTIELNLNSASLRAPSSCSINIS